MSGTYLFEPELLFDMLELLHEHVSALVGAHLVLDLMRELISAYQRLLGTQRRPSCIHDPARDLDLARDLDPARDLDLARDLDPA